MSKRGNDNYDYKEESTASFGPTKRTRRKINNQTSDSNLNESPKKAPKKVEVKANLNDKYDYNIDESINEDRPTINKNSYVFNPPINEKNGSIASINFQDGINSKLKQSKNFDDDIGQVSPINARNGYTRDKRTSDLVEFQTPNIAGLSPIGHSSTVKNNRKWKLDQNLDMQGSDDSDDAQIIDSDLIRGRNKDISPHNRHARPRSSCIK